MIRLLEPLTDAKPILRAARVTRDGRYLGPLVVDDFERQRLAEQSLGLLVGGIPSYESMLHRLKPLCEGDADRWIAVPGTKYLSEKAASYFRDEGLPISGALRSGRWRCGSLEFSTVEQLRTVDADSVSGVILLDPQAVVHRGRKHELYPGRYHDRPQRVVDFVAAAAVARSPGPPLVLMTTKRPSALPTAEMAGTYCLDAWYFLDGTATRFTYS